MRTNGKVTGAVARLAVSAAVLVSSAASARADEEILTLSEARAQRLSSVAAPNAGPEGDWGHVRGVLVGTGLSFIAPCDEALAAERESEILTLGKLVFEDVILPAGGQIGDWLAEGELAGIELDVFGSDDPMDRPSASQHLGTVGVLRIAIEASPGYEDVGFVYCYSAAQLAARLDALEDAPVVPRDVYYGPVLHGSATGNYAMHLVTSGTQVQGEVLTNGKFRLVGESDSIAERVRYREGSDVRGTGHVLGEMVDEPADTILSAPPFSASHYATLATSNNTFFNHDISIVMGPSGLETSLGVPVSGVVYSTGDIIVSGSELSGSLSLVAEGSVEFSGDTNAFQAFADGILAWSLDDQNSSTPNQVVVSGTDNTLTGRMYARGDAFQLLGDSASIVGSVIAYKVLISGDGHTIGDGTTP